MILFTEYDHLRGVTEKQYNYLLDIMLRSIQYLCFKYNRSLYFDEKYGKYKPLNSVSEIDSLYLWCRETKYNLNSFISAIYYRRFNLSQKIRIRFQYIDDLVSWFYCSGDVKYGFVHYHKSPYPILLDEIYKPFILKRIKLYKRHYVSENKYSDRCLKDIYVIMLNRFHYCEKYPVIKKGEEKPRWYDYTMKELKYFKEHYGHLYKKRSKM